MNHARSQMKGTLFSSHQAFGCQDHPAYIFRIVLFMFFISLLRAVHQVDIDNSAYQLRERDAFLATWKPFRGSVLVPCSLAPVSQSCQATCMQAGCLQFGAMEEGKIFWLMCSDVNGLSPSQLRHSRCLTNACPFSSALKMLTVSCRLQQERKLCH